MVDRQHDSLSIVRQCRLVSVARSSFYYEARGESPENLRLMRQIDEQFLETPFYGTRQMTRWLLREGETVGRKRVRRLMRLLGLQAIYRPAPSEPSRLTSRRRRPSDPASASKRLTDHATRSVQCLLSSGEQTSRRGPPYVRK